ncbi:MAG: tRNA-dihydrouridine synthase [Desulfobulbaceae bacterium BRH_c16a]|nr:MAG: tRNA-dihydrouridine synthase [Desulfobulbaceae bacterium BRH_c16a]
MFKIAHLSFDSPFVLAPLAGYTNLPFRLLCRKYGASYCVSEMISCHGLVYKERNTLRMLASVEAERPISFQLFGADPEAMADAAEILASYGPDMIDINMGCPAKKVTKRGAGAALMTAPECARDILTKVVSRVSIPVSVKIRSGKDSLSINAVPFAKMAEDCGVAAIIVHARTWAQGFSGSIDPSVISDVKKSVTIPVIGNGDVLSLQDGYRMMDATGCDGVMIGRGALGNPWIFKQNTRPEDVREIIATAQEHLGLIEEHLPVERLLGYIKNQMCRYFRDFPGSSAERKKIFTIPSLGELKDYIESFGRQQ